MNPTTRTWLKRRISAWLDRAAHDGPFTAIRAFLDAPAPARADTAPVPDDGPLAHVGRCFDLGPDERGLLVLAAAPALSVQIHDVYTALRTGDAITLGFLCDLAGDGPGQGDRCLRLARRPGGLIESGLLALRGSGPIGGRRAEVPPEIAAALAGEAVLPSPGLAAALRAPVEPCPWDDAAQVALTPPGGQMVAVTGDPGAGRLAALAAAHGGLMVIDAALLGARDDATALLDEAERIVRLNGAHLVLDLDGLEAPDATPLRWLARTRAVTLLVSTAEQLPPWLRRRVRTVQAPRTTIGEAVGGWRAALSRWRDVADVGPLSESLGQRFPLGRAAIVETVAQTPPGDIPALHAALRRYVPHNLSTLADRYETALGWDDVVLDDAARAGLREIELHARRRRQVLEGWGLQRLLPYGRGLACLFSGPPGTGKTMVAGVLANSLERELYRVDISRVVSKWLGETEKGLARLFDEAERAGAMLFFDEADSLFARRTEVRGSNDRHANMAVNFLLQRMEAFDGISILATNIESGIDEAFRRRLRFTVRFDEPGATQRAALWGKMLRGGLPVAEVDTAKLGRKFRFTGALIKNAVVRAAFRAADRGCEIDTKLLLEAGQAELHAQGRL